MSGRAMSAARAELAAPRRPAAGHGACDVHPLLAAWPAIGHRVPSLEALEAWRCEAQARDGIVRPAFVAQTPALLADGLHYEARIAERGLLATREDNWHDLFNALVWLRHPRLKWALNARQAADVALVGPKTRTRGQCAMTQFDEAGAIVWHADPALLVAWSAHDWPALFRCERAAWGRRIAVTVFGHALLERQHLGGDPLSTAKTIAVHADADAIAERCSAGSIIASWPQAEERIAEAIADGRLLTDPQQPRPLPLAGIPGWHADGASPDFHRDAPCFRPLREGREYPPPLSLAEP